MTVLLKMGYFSCMQVHLANGVLIKGDVYDHLMAVPKDSHFVKRSASAIWSTEVLARRSVTGTLSNRTLAEMKGVTPKRQLTPHKVEALKIFFRHYAEARGSDEEEIKKATKNIRMWLSQKTSELRRRRPQQQDKEEAPPKTSTDQEEEAVDEAQEATEK
ncbi:BEN domain-containing protein 5-like [Haemaphysalis longicornis]